MAEERAQKNANLILRICDFIRFSAFPGVVSA